MSPYPHQTMLTHLIEVRPVCRENVSERIVFSRIFVIAIQWLGVAVCPSATVLCWQSRDNIATNLREVRHNAPSVHLAGMRPDNVIVHLASGVTFAITLFIVTAVRALVNHRGQIEIGTVHSKLVVAEL